MTFNSLVTILLGGILANNYALEKLLGITPFLGWSRREDKAAAVGLATAVTMLLSAAVTWPLQVFVLDRLALGYLQILLFVAVILALTFGAEALLKKTAGKSLGAFFPLLVLNSAVLGLCVNNVTAGLSYVEALVSALGAGLGFMLGMAVFSSLLARISQSCVPKAFRGLPISLVAAFIFSMLLTAFK